MATVIDPEEIGAQAKSALEDIQEYVLSAPFQSLLAELWSLPREQRDRFVREVMLASEALAERDATPPDGITIQRSSFADGRPTVFCVTKLLPDGIRKMTITFDNEMVPTPG